MALAAGGSRTYCYDAAGNLTGDNAGLAVRYDHTQRPLRIARGGVAQRFDYAPDGSRFREWGTDGETQFFGPLERRYVPAAQDKLYAGPNTLVTRAGSSRTVTYLLTDRLGSVDAIASAAGTLIETRGYDAFGKPRTGTWANTSPPRLGSTANTPHGFTGHEHLNSLELIHMNGRVYDYNLGRFMGVDPVIQFPMNSQSLNPYSYILNNPLSGTDPTGYFVCTGSHIDKGEPCGDGGGLSTTIMSGAGDSSKRYTVTAVTKDGSRETHSGTIAQLRNVSIPGLSNGAQLSTPGQPLGNVASLDRQGEARSRQNRNEAFPPREGETATGKYGLFPEYAEDNLYKKVYQLALEGNTLSGRRDREFSAFGAKDEDGTPVFQELSGGTTARMTQSRLIEQAQSFRAAHPGLTIAYSFHTHGTDFDIPGGYENFSPQDIDYYRFNRNVGPVIGFLATPRGLLLMYDPATGKPAQIGRLPSIVKPIGR